MNPQSPALPPHTIRESTRTRHVHLRFSLRDGLEVVVPPGFDRGEIPSLLRAKATWIERVEREFERERRRLDAAPPDRLPTTINLRALGEVWTVRAIPTESRRLALREAEGRCLVLQGPVSFPQSWRPALKRWLAKKAKSVLSTWIASEAAAHRWRYGRISIRWQRSRWGSCSRRGAGAPGTASTLTLNASLLFLPPHLVRYVVVHELCHTRHLNHSAAFWRCLEAIEPGARALRNELREAWRYPPTWLDDERPGGPPRPLTTPADVS